MVTRRVVVFFFCFAFSRHFRATELRKIVFLAKIVRSRSVKLIRQYIFIYGNAAHQLRGVATNVCNLIYDFSFKQAADQSSCFLVLQVSLLFVFSQHFDFKNTLCLQTSLSRASLHEHCATAFTQALHGRMSRRVRVCLNTEDTQDS